MRINTGEFRIDYFDRYGARLKAAEQMATSHTEAVAKGERFLKDNEQACSFIVVRQVYNSLDSRSRW